MNNKCQSPLALAARSVGPEEYPGPVPCNGPTGGDNIDVGIVSFECWENWSKDQEDVELDIAVNVIS